MAGSGRWSSRSIVTMGAVSMIFALLGGFCILSPEANAEDRSRGEIRLLGQLSGVPSTVAVAPNGSFVLTSTGDGNVSIFDVNARYGQHEVLISSPIRSEEFQKQRALALAPFGDLVSLGAPLERST